MHEQQDPIQTMRETKMSNLQNSTALNHSLLHPFPHPFPQPFPHSLTHAHTSTHRNEKFERQLKALALVCELDLASILQELIHLNSKIVQRVPAHERTHMQK